MAASCEALAAVAEGVRACCKPAVAPIALGGLGMATVIARTLATGISWPVSSTRPSRGAPCDLADLLVARVGG